MCVCVCVCVCVSVSLCLCVCVCVVYVRVRVRVRVRVLCVCAPVVHPSMQVFALTSASPLHKHGGTATARYRGDAEHASPAPVSTPTSYAAHNAFPRRRRSGPSPDTSTGVGAGIGGSSRGATGAIGPRPRSQQGRAKSAAVRRTPVVSPPTIGASGYWHAGGTGSGDAAMR